MLTNEVGSLDLALENNVVGAWKMFLQRSCLACLSNHVKPLT